MAKGSQFPAVQIPWKPVVGCRNSSSVSSLHLAKQDRARGTKKERNHVRTKIKTGEKNFREYFCRTCQTQNSVAPRATKGIPKNHPLRRIRRLCDIALKALSREFDRMYSETGRPSIAPEKLLRALLLQILYTIRSERMLMEQLDFNLLFRWFGRSVGRDGVQQESRTNVEI